MKYSLLSVLFFVVGSTAVAQTGTIDELVSWMTGTFSSTVQAEQDSDYYAISLVMTPVWQERYPGQHWLYVEQALVSRMDKPYRQRIYQVEALLDGRFRSAVYLLPDEEASIGKYADPPFFDQWEPEDLDLREGCAVYLTLVDGSYTGATKGQDCQSSLRGARFASSMVTISRDRIISWDQGFDAAGTQVWGAEKGGYVFDRY